MTQVKKKNEALPAPQEHLGAFPSLVEKSFACFELYINRVGNGT